MVPSDSITITNKELTKQFESNLVYRKTERRDTSIYILTVTNEWGKDSCEIDVVVLGESIILAFQF